jgi:Tc5 transposase DNA-binding domain.
MNSSSDTWNNLEAWKLYKSCSVIMAAYNIGSSTISDMKKQKDQLQSFMASSESVKGLWKWQTSQQPYDKMLYKWFTAVRSKGEPMTGPKIERLKKSFYDEIKITDKCSFSYDWQQNFKDCHGIRKLNIIG